MVRRIQLACILILPAFTGCMGLFHEPPPIHPTEWRAADEVSDEAKSCVYVFMFDGTSPLSCGTMEQMRCYLNDIGFGKTFCGYPMHLSYFAEKVRMIQARCPTARFSIIGFCDGAGAAHKLAAGAARDGIVIDLLVLMEPTCTEQCSSEEVVRTLTINGSRCRDASQSGEVVELGVTPCAAIPTDPRTLETVEKELTLIAFGVPAKPRPPAPIVNLVPPMPSPRDKQLSKKPLPAEWDFLRPWGFSETSKLRPDEKAVILPAPRIAPSESKSVNK